MGLEEAHVIMCVAGYINGQVNTAETGEEESIGDSNEGKGIERVES